MVDDSLRTFVRLMVWKNVILMASVSPEYGLADWDVFDIELHLLSAEVQSIVLDQQTAQKILVLAFPTRKLRIKLKIIFYK